MLERLCGSADLAVRPLRAMTGCGAFAVVLSAVAGKYPPRMRELTLYDLDRVRAPPRFVSMDA